MLRNKSETPLCRFTISNSKPAPTIFTIRPLPRTVATILEDSLNLNLAKGLASSESIADRFQGPARGRVARATEASSRLGRGGDWEVRTRSAPGRILLLNTGIRAAKQGGLWEAARRLWRHLHKGRNRRSDVYLPQA